jgi:transcription-repair coupling factor (superfamily II helicase)
VRTEFDDSITNRLLAGRLLPNQVHMVLTWQQVVYKTDFFSRALFMNMAHTPRDFDKLGEVISFTARPCMPLRRKPDELKEDLSYWLSQNFNVVILAGPRRHGQTLAESIAELRIPVRYMDALDAPLTAGVVTVTRGTMITGFEYINDRLAVVTDKELFAQERKRSRARSKNAAKIDHFSDLRIGDHVVHDNHGVGIFKGIEQVTIDGSSRDYLKLEYSDGGHLYVQTAQLDMVQKYIGGTASIKLNKLGGADWVRTKSRVRKTVEILASDLIELYARRQAAQGGGYCLAGGIRKPVSI